MYICNTVYFNSTIYYVQSGEAIQSGETMRTSIRSCKSFLTNADIIRFPSVRFMLMFIAGGQPSAWPKVEDIEKAKIR